MAYTPTTWVTGDTITAVKLNNMEQGIANSYLYYVGTTYDDTKGGCEIDEPLADLAQICESGRICKTTGDIYDAEIKVASAPWGGYWVDVVPQITIEPGYTPPRLVYLTYEWDATQSVLIESTLSYSLTPTT